METCKIGQGVKFERIRRITGYLVGTIDRFNDAKRAEVQDRVKHASVGKPSNEGARQSVCRSSSPRYYNPPTD